MDHAGRKTLHMLGLGLMFICAVTFNPDANPFINRSHKQITLKCVCVCIWVFYRRVAIRYDYLHLGTDL